MIIYGLDGLIFLAVGEYLGFGFHLFALFLIFLVSKFSIGTAETRLIDGFGERTCHSGSHNAHIGVDPHSPGFRLIARFTSG